MEVYNAKKQRMFLDSQSRKWHIDFSDNKTNTKHALATHHIISATSLWLLVPMYMGTVHTSLLLTGYFSLFRLITLCFTTVISVIYWGYYANDTNAIMTLDINLARLTALNHLIYSIPEYTLTGIVCSSMI